jgi:DNA-binding transcriptional LysR family regulator
MSTIGLSRLAPAIAEFAREAPGCELAVHQGSPRDLAAKITSETLDVALLNVVDDIAPSLRAQSLYLERYQVILPPNHPLLASDVITLAALANYPYVDRLLCELRDVVASVSAERGIPLYAKFRSEREDWVEGLVRAGLGFAFMPEYCILERDTPRRLLVDPEVTRTISVLTAPSRALPPAAATLTKILSRHVWS